LGDYCLTPLRMKGRKDTLPQVHLHRKIRG
jgi:hypothetical protein